MIPSSSWRAWVRSRSASQPSSNCPRNRVDPFRPDMVRRVRGARREVDEERLAGCRRLLEAHPFDRAIGQVLREVIVVAPDVRLDRRGLVVERRLPLRCLAAQEPVEALETQPGGPAVERACGARLPHGRDVRLAEHRRAVAVEAQDLGDGGRAARDDPVVAREAVGDLGDPAHVGAVVVAAGQERGPGRRAQGGRVELVVGDALRGHPVQGRRRDRTTERARRPEPDVVVHHDDDVRGTVRRQVDLRPRRCGVGRQLGDRAPERAVGRRQGDGHGGSMGGR